MKKIDIKVDKLGNATIVDLSGYGTKCGNISDRIEALLGKGDDNTREKTEEYFKQELEVPVNG